MTSNTENISLYLLLFMMSLFI